MGVGMSSCSLRYRNTASSSGYGKAVMRHLTSLRRQLEKEPEPKRKPYLRLLKQIADFIVAKEKAAQANASNKQ